MITTEDLKQLLDYAYAVAYRQSQSLDDEFKSAANLAVAETLISYRQECGLTLKQAVARRVCSRVIDTLRKYRTATVSFHALEHAISRSAGMSIHDAINRLPYGQELAQRYFVERATKHALEKLTGLNREKLDRRLRLIRDELRRVYEDTV